jgi:hypothetical protein
MLEGSSRQQQWLANAIVACTCSMGSSAQQEAL